MADNGELVFYVKLYVRPERADEWKRAAFIKQTAREFQALHWARFVFSLAGSALVFTGFLKFYRHCLIAADAPRQT